MVPTEWTVLMELMEPTVLMDQALTKSGWPKATQVRKPTSSIALLELMVKLVLMEPTAQMVSTEWTVLMEPTD